MLKKYIEKAQIIILAASSMITTITIFLIVIFLFTYGLEFFSNSAVEKGFDIAVHSSNPVSKLSPTQVQQIFDQEIISWNAVGGSNDSLEILHMEDLAIHYTEE